jgi:hypothetical protein
MSKKLKKPGATTQTFVILIGVGVLNILNACLAFGELERYKMITIDNFHKTLD